MTELDLFYKHVPDIAEMVNNLREKTPEQRRQWEKDCLEYADRLSPFVHGFFQKTFIVIDKYFEEINLFICTTDKELADDVALAAEQPKGKGL